MELLQLRQYQELRKAGFVGALIGESFMTRSDPVQAAMKFISEFSHSADAG